MVDRIERDEKEQERMGVRTPEPVEGKTPFEEAKVLGKQCMDIRNASGTLKNPGAPVSDLFEDILSEYKWTSLGEGGVSLLGFMTNLTETGHNPITSKLEMINGKYRYIMHPIRVALEPVCNNITGVVNRVVNREFKGVGSIFGVKLGFVERLASEKLVEKLEKSATVVGDGVRDQLSVEYEAREEELRVGIASIKRAVFGMGEIGDVYTPDIIDDIEMTNALKQALRLEGDGAGSIELMSSRGMNKVSSRHGKLVRMARKGTAVEGSLPALSSSIDINKVRETCKFYEKPPSLNSGKIISMMESNPYLASFINSNEDLRSLLDSLEERGGGWKENDEFTKVESWNSFRKTFRAKLLLLEAASVDFRSYFKIRGELSEELIRKYLVKIVKGQAASDILEGEEGQENGLKHEFVRLRKEGADS